MKMPALTLFNYEDFVKLLRRSNTKLVGIYQGRKGDEKGFLKIEVRASALSKDTIIELVYYRVIVHSAFVEDKEKELEEKARELEKKLKDDGFEVVDGYWHSGV